MQPSEASIIGWRYRLIESIGSGGMGTVFRAEDRLAREIVALKRVNTHLLLHAEEQWVDQDHRVLMTREFKTLAALRHPNIIAVRDYGFDTTGQPYFTMDLLENPQTIIQAGRDGDFQTRINYLVQTLQALAYLHRRGVIHRDLKPANLLVVNNQVKLLDFGLSVARDADDADRNSIYGTLAYMAPELFEGDEATQVSDLYAVGVIAYELFAGSHPFALEKVQNLIAEILHTEPDLGAMDVDFSLEAVVDRLLAKNPDDRFASASEAIQALRAALGMPIPLETKTARRYFLQLTRIVGRDRELMQLTRYLVRLKDREGGACLIGGESGVGKSRLLEEVRIQASVKGMLVLRGQAFSEAGGVYQIWQSVFRWIEMVGDSNAPTLTALLPSGNGHTSRPLLSPDALRERLVLRIIETLQGMNQPVIMTFEDLQWAGSDSLSLLNVLCRRVGELPLLILATYRKDEAQSLPQYLPHMDILNIERLSAEGIAALSREILGDAGNRPKVIAYLQRQTEGNVYYLIETMRMLAEDVDQIEAIGEANLPTDQIVNGMQRVVERRLSQIPVSHRDLLYMAAAFGRWLDLNLLKALSPDTDLETWLLTGMDATIIEVENNQWRFAHDQMRKGILSVIPSPARQALHHHLAMAIETLYPDSLEHLHELAYHWRMASNPEREGVYAAKAAELSVRSGAYEEALKLVERAFMVLPEGSEHMAARLKYRRINAHAHLGLGNYPEAEDSFQKNLAESQQQQYVQGIADSLASLGEVFVALEHYDEAYTRFTESVGHFRSLGNMEAVARVLNHLGNISYELGYQTQAKTYYQESLDLSRRIGSGWGKAGASPMVTSVQRVVADAPDTQADYQVRRDELLTALSTARRSGDKMQMADTMRLLGEVEAELGKPVEARRLWKLTIASYRALNNIEKTVMTLHDLGQLALTQQEYADAFRDLQNAVTIALTDGMDALVWEVLLDIVTVLDISRQKEQAVMLLAHIITNPDTPDPIVDAAEARLFDLVSVLDDKIVQTAWEQGKRAALGELMAAINRLDLP